MTRTTIPVVLVSLVVAIAGAAHLAARQGSAKVQPIVMPAQELKWTDLDPVGAPGVKLAVLWGDQGKGAFGALFRLPAGFAAPLHTHTHDMKVLIVSGTYVQAPEEKPEFRLGPGSYLMQPGGGYKHTTRCEQGTDCVFLVESGGPFDMTIVAEK